MKTQLRIATLAVLCLVMAATGSAQVLYSNGLCNNMSDCDTDAWTINYGYAVSDSFKVTGPSTASSVNFDVWLNPGDKVLSVDWSITSQEFGGTVYGSGVGTPVTLVKDLGFNGFGYDIQELSFQTGASGTFLPNSGASTYWLNLQNVVNTTPNAGVFWDENSGKSLASENSFGTIPSESFQVNGSSGGTTPEPGSFMLLGSGVLGIAGVLRRRLMG